MIQLIILSLCVCALTWAAPTPVEVPSVATGQLASSSSFVQGDSIAGRTLNSTQNNCWEYWSRKWRQHEESWIMNKVWKFQCNNGSASIVACIGSERSKFAEIGVGQDLEVDGFWHRCSKDGDTVRYSQEPSCVVDGKELHVGETFSQGKFQMKCSTDGYSIIGCFYTDEEGIEKVIQVGKDVNVGVVKHSCQTDPKLPGRVLYSSFTTACKRNDKIFQEGETWVSNHLKFVCGERGAYSIKSCITNDGDEIDVGMNVTISGIMHQCYRIGNTVYYHSFSCAIDDAACREAETNKPVASDDPDVNQSSNGLEQVDGDVNSDSNDNKHNGNDDTEDSGNGASEDNGNEKFADKP